jgi:hypothetical protein
MFKKRITEGSNELNHYLPTELQMRSAFCDLGEGGDVQFLDIWDFSGIKTRFRLCGFDWRR